MKLRSGKVIPYGVHELPKELNDVLKQRLQKFKEASHTHPQHAKELLEIIKDSWSIESRFPIRDKIYEVYDPNNLKATIPLQGAAGDLAWFLVGHPEYRNLIQNQMEIFDLNVSVLGNIEE